MPEFWGIRIDELNTEIVRLENENAELRRVLKEIKDTKSDWGEWPDKAIDRIGEILKNSGL